MRCFNIVHSLIINKRGTFLVQGQIPQWLHTILAWVLISSLNVLDVALSLHSSLVASSTYVGGRPPT